jgi:hypothetical protein
LKKIVAASRRKSVGAFARQVEMARVLGSRSADSGDSACAPRGAFSRGSDQGPTFDDEIPF